jgi:hypothetical protein
MEFEQYSVHADCLDKMWEPRRLTTLWAFKACYRDSFTFYSLHIIKLSTLKHHYFYNIK